VRAPPEAARSVTRQIRRRSIAVKSQLRIRGTNPRERCTHGASISSIDQCKGLARRVGPTRLLSSERRTYPTLDVANGRRSVEPSLPAMLTSLLKAGETASGEPSWSGLDHRQIGELGASSWLLDGDVLGLMSIGKERKPRRLVSEVHCDWSLSRE